MPEPAHDNHRRRLDGKAILVTGASSNLGIGFAAARRLAGEGARLVLTDIDESGVRARASELTELGFTAVGLAHDVAREDDWQRVIGKAVETFSRFDGLVNNAGIVILNRIEDLSPADWQRQIDVNLTGAFLGCRAAIRQLREAGSGGTIVNVSSIAGLVGMPRTAAYSASKGGLSLMSKTLAIECAAEAIRINSVHPGVIATDIQRRVREHGTTDSDAIAATIPMRKMGRPEDIAAGIAFLLSEDAAYVTGTELVIDGGYTAQ